MTEPQTAWASLMEGAARHPESGNGLTVVRHSDILAIERQAADAALADLAETVPGLDHPAPSDSYDDGWNEAIAAVLDAIATAVARKETT